MRASAVPDQPPVPRSTARLAAELFVASFVVLFQELALIRWMPGQVRVLAYFPNLILLSAFLGLGLGCLRAGRPLRLWLWPASLVLLVLSQRLLSRIAFTQESASEHLWLFYLDLDPAASVVSDIRLPILLAFLVTVLAFMPLGQFVAERLREFRAGSSALWGYCWDIAGSLAGVVAFAAVGFLQTFPVVWFALFLAAGLLLVASTWRRCAVSLGLMGIILLIVGGAERADLYSPYYALSLKPAPFGTIVMTNGSFHQYAMSLRRDTPAPEGRQAQIREDYHFPYGLLDKRPRRALVLGAGTGNDVAVLLAQGVDRIDAVEIDPVILGLGGRIHPDRPYESPRVRTIVADARSYLRETRESYDLIVFGTLDSMTRLSALSSVRLDNFVYTLDCLRDARSRLSPLGGIVLYFMVKAEHIDQRLAGMLTDVFGQIPLLRPGAQGLFNRTYMAGPAFAAVSGPERTAAAPGALRQLRERLELPTDDWPYLYLKDRGISGFYLSLMAVFVGVALVGIAAVSRDMRRSLATGRRVDWVMLFCGLAFLLLETKLVTEMNLVWGATWLTSAVVFGSILATILAATVLSRLRPLAWRWSAGLLLAALGAAYLLPVHLLMALDWIPRLGMSLLYVGMPIFFAGTFFGAVFDGREHADLAFGWNLLGAVLGGLLEFLSMAVGFKALLLLAMAAYLCAFLVHARSHPPAARPACGA